MTHAMGEDCASHAMEARPHAINLVDGPPKVNVTERDRGGGGEAPKAI